MLIRAWPVAGPLVDGGMEQSIPAIFTWDGTGHGEVTVNLQNGESCHGDYTCIAKRSHPPLFVFADYQRYYGTHFNFRNLQYGQALIHGDRGTIIQAEYYMNLRLNRRYGLARDNRNNIFKFF